MAKEPEKEKLNLSIPIKVDILFRQQALDTRNALSDLFIEYQNAYSEKLEEVKQDKKLLRELSKNGTVICPKCEQTTNKILTAPTEKK